MKIKDDNIIFSSGKVEYANRGIIGIDNELHISEGYDGGISELSRSEKAELADYMIAKWREFKTMVEADGQMKELELMEDIIQIAKYLQWDNNVGRLEAQKIMDSIHNGKYESKCGIWVQADDAIKKLKSYKQVVK